MATAMLTCLPEKTDIELHMFIQMNKPNLEFMQLRPTSRSHHFLSLTINRAIRLIRIPNVLILATTPIRVIIRPLFNQTHNCIVTNAHIEYIASYYFRSPLVH